ncbi:hypothetical protein ACGFZ9_47540 [Streptomyces mirabilis]|uniref:hypothetical protein n=1 Tax=Streptomyces mirabilis TaxID=68239 RepID=UPI00371F9948
MTVAQQRNSLSPFPFPCTVVEFASGGLGLIPKQADAKIPREGITWNCTTWLDIASCYRTCGRRWRASRR